MFSKPNRGMESIANYLLLQIGPNVYICYKQIGISHNAIYRHMTKYAANFAWWIMFFRESSISLLSYPKHLIWAVFRYIDVNTVPYETENSVLIVLRKVETGSLNFILSIVEQTPQRLIQVSGGHSFGCNRTGGPTKFHSRLYLNHWRHIIYHRANALSKHHIWIPSCRLQTS